VSGRLLELCDRARDVRGEASGLQMMLQQIAEANVILENQQPHETSLKKQCKAMPGAEFDGLACPSVSMTKA